MCEFCSCGSVIYTKDCLHGCTCAIWMLKYKWYLENVPAKILLPGKFSSEDSTTWKIFQRRFYYLENLPAKTLLPGKYSREDSTTWKAFQRRFYYLENFPAKTLLPGKYSREDSTTWKIFQRRFYYLEKFPVESSLENFPGPPDSSRIFPGILYWRCKSLWNSQRGSLGHMKYTRPKKNAAY